MKVFDGKKAAEEYMSSHTLTFSTPELTLMRYSYWLGDMVPDPENKQNVIPRLMTFVEERDFAPSQVNVIDDEKFVPTGAVKNTGMYGSHEKETDTSAKFCAECGTKISNSAKFCPECGTTAD